MPSHMDQRPFQSGQTQRSTRGADYQFVPRPVAGLADEYPPGHIDPPHSHVRAQLLYAISGVTIIITRGAQYVLPPQRALWLPAGMEHEVHFRDRVSIRTLYIQPDAVPDLPEDCRVIEVSPLLRELIVEATRIPVEYDTRKRDGLVMALILDELQSANVVPLRVPMPDDPRLVRVCEAILKDLSQDKTLDAWASLAAMGRRTFTRAFRRETGMSFAVWCQNARLMEAITRLATGAQVTAVALDVGYSSPSAFTAMFRRMFGVPPTHYMAARPEEPAA